MATCVNCGAKIGTFDSSARSLYPGSQDVLCGKCLSAFKHNFDGIEIKRDFIEKNYGTLKANGFTPDGFRYLEGYVKYKNRNEIEAENRALKEEEQDRIYQVRSNFKTTTGYNFEGYEITNYIGIISGEVVLGTGVFSEFSAGISDLFGIKSTIMAQKITDTKQAALQKLIDNCILKGANAVIGVDIDFMTIGSNMISACANGTAVTIEKR